jgi:hypothetical protein
MARPGLEPGTPRFSVVLLRGSSSAHLQGKYRCLNWLAPSAFSRTLRSFPVRKDRYRGSSACCDGAGCVCRRGVQRAEPVRPAGVVPGWRHVGSVRWRLCRVDRPARLNRRLHAGTLTDDVASVTRVRNATHELVGVSLAVAAGLVLEARPLETAGLAASALLGSRLPDVDQVGARVHRRTALERRTVLAGAAGALLRLPLTMVAVSCRTGR